MNHSRGIPGGNQINGGMALIIKVSVQSPVPHPSKGNGLSGNIPGWFQMIITVKEIFSQDQTAGLTAGITADITDGASGVFHQKLFCTRITVTAGRLDCRRFMYVTLPITRWVRRIIAINILVLAAGMIFLDYRVTAWSLISGIFLSSFCFSSLGVLLASPAVKSPSNIMMLSSLVRFPLIFISGIFIPLSELSPAGRIL